MLNRLEFYAEYDEETSLYHVFDTETGKSHYSSFTMEQAETRAEEMNNN
jgi:hypothetical protein